MIKLKVGIIREEKIPHDKRVPLIPAQCRQVMNEFPQVEIVVQPCEWRAFKDEEFIKEGIKTQEDISDCDILLGIKEVPVDKEVLGVQLVEKSNSNVESDKLDPEFEKTKKVLRITVG